MKPSNQTAVWLVVLVALSTALQTWVILHARLPAVDTVNFVAHAQLIERDGVIAALRADPSPPLYPLSMLTLRRVMQACDCQISWALTAQLAAAIPLVLCVVPVYWLARQVFNPRASFTAALLFVVMTQVARMGAEALSDSAHLLCFCLALVACGKAVAAERLKPQTLWSLAGGMCVGLALLARAEAWILVPAVTLAPLCITSLDWPGRVKQSLLTSLATVTGIALFTFAWLAPLGVYQPYAIVERLLVRRGYVEEMPINLPATVASTDYADSTDWQLTSGEPMQFGRKDPTVSIRFRGFTAAVARFTAELLQSWQYLVGILAAVGVAMSRELWWRPTVSLHRLVFVLFALALLAFATRHGYLERRHLLPLIVLSLPWAGCGVLRIGEQLANRLQTNAQRTQWAMIVGTALLLVSTSLLPLHPGRVAHRDAAAWLAAQPETGAVLDTIGHSALYTGRTTYRHEIAPAALADPDLQFVVIESAELRYNSPRAATLRELIARFGTLAAKFEPPPERVGPVVHVYRWSQDRFAFQHGLSDAR
jgi:4-amino-4-deoxy-L-arabinose transferase-like glycosyltransferase